MDVHCVGSPEEGTRILLAFPGYHKPNSPQRRAQVDLIAGMARSMGDVIEPIDETDISMDIAIRLAARMHANPGVQVILMPFEEGDQ